MPWTDDRVDTLKKLWAKGLSASAIAGTIGEVTRNAVIGKAHRLRLAGRATTSRKRQPLRPSPLFPARSRSRNIRSRPRACQDRQPHSNATPKLISILPELGAPPEQLITIQSLNERTCHWPIGDPKRDGFHFCGRSKPERRAYCDHHAALSYR